MLNAGSLKTGGHTEESTHTVQQKMLQLEIMYR
nr:MAG TPA: hypothetical protein [Caudoviricetes sp.]